MLISETFLRNKTKADFVVKSVAEVCQCQCSEAGANCSMEPATEVLTKHAGATTVASSTVTSRWGIELVPSQTDASLEASRRVFRFMHAGRPCADLGWL